MRVSVTQDTSEMPQLYTVRHTCGHTEQRRMRPSLAGVPVTVELEASNKCRNCDRRR